MSPLSFLRRHPRGDLSAYIDGQLSPSASSRLESHLASCEFCASEVESLRAISAALHDLPELVAPRSFTLTPQQVAEAYPTASPVSHRNGSLPLANGLRLASVGLAAALAFAVFIDVGGVSDDSGGDDSGAVALLDNTESAAIGAENPAAAAGVGADGSGSREEGETDDSTEMELHADDAYAGSPPIDNTAVAPSPGPEPTGAADTGTADEDLPLAPGIGEPTDPAAPVDGELDKAAPSANDRLQGDVAAATGAAEDLSLASAAASEDDGDGSTLLIVEIALAAALVAALIASFVLTRARKF